MIEIFISYSHRNFDQALTFKSFLESKNYSVWRDEESIIPGRMWDREIEQGILRADIVLVLWSKDANASENVRNEILWAQEEAKKQLIFLLLDQTALPLIHFRSQYINLSEDWGRGCERVHQVLQYLFYGSGTSDNMAVASAPAPEVVAPPLPTSPPHNSPTAGAINPFIFGTAVHEDWFVNQRRALDRINSFLCGQSMGSVSIVGERRMGKTSLLNYVVKRYDSFLQCRRQWAFIYIDMMGARAKQITDVMALLRESIRQQLQSPPWEASQDGDLKALQTAFENLSARGERIVLCFDEFEKAIAHGDTLNDLLEALRSAGSQGHIAMITATATPLDELVTGSRVTSPFHNIFSTVYLKPMTTADWQQIVRIGFERTNRPLQLEQLDLVGFLSGGHPYLVQMASHFVWLYAEQLWDEAQTQIVEDFHEQSRQYFSTLWTRLSSEHKNAVLEALNLPRNGNVIGRYREGLKSLGIITANGVFCEPFAEFVRGMI